MARFFQRLGALLGLGRSQGDQGAAESADATIRLLSKHTTDVIARIGPDDRILYISDAAFQMFGRHPKEMIGQKGKQYFLEEDLTILDASRQRLDNGATAVSNCLRVNRPDDRLVWVECNVQRVPVKGSATEFELVMVVRDVTERQLLETRLEALALEDGLTGLANRRAFDQTLDREWRRTVRDGSQMALILIDADHFKSFNDHYGHQVGDDCLRAVAAAIKGCLTRSGDLAARYGGEELAVILPGTGAEGAAVVAESIRAAVERLGIPHETNDPTKSVTISLGVAAALSREGGTMRMPESLLQAADAALYRAKSKGRNRVESSLLLAPAESRLAG